MISLLVVGAALYLGALPGEEAYLKAREAEAKGHYADAQPFYGACAGEDPLLAPYARVRAAVCRGRAGDREGAAGELQQLLESLDAGPWNRMAKAELARLHMALKRPGDAVPLLDSVLNLPAIPRFLEPYQWDYADSLIASESTRSDGYALCQALLRDARTRKTRLDAAKRLAESPDVGQRLDAVHAYLLAGESHEAKKLMLIMTPALLLDKGRHEAQVLYLQGRLQAGGEGGAGRTALESVVQRFPKELPWANLALAYLARDVVSPSKGQPDLSLFDKLAAGYPGTQETGDAFWWLAQWFAGKDQREAAAGAYLRLAQVCPGHKLADDALFEAAALYRRLDKASRAIEILDSLAKAHPNGTRTAEALFEAGRLRESEGDHDGAVASYSGAARLVGDFYAHRAMERLNELKAATAADLRVSAGRSFIRPVPLGELPAPDYPTGLTGEPWFQRLAFFASHGFEEAEWEALDLVPRMVNGPDPGPCYRALADAGLTAMAIQVAEASGWGLKDGAPTLERLWVLYPRAYWDLVQCIARETGLDPFLILAVGRQESVFQSRVVSSAGATGVMQLMPATASWLAGVEPAVSGTHSANLTHPANSLRLGAYYLMRMIERNDANLVFALASYNAGPGNVAKWRRRVPTSDMEAFVEAIPFEETRGFVKKVLGNYAAYHSLYNGEQRVATAR
ncbi:MAG: transglycosylase SLT domain-containing protein [Candidatus Hydrogenedentes bacterium]|nr:transglycosylase SLT domain-containing protein [Candidatus Hydrogenedentota bacterium]